MTDYPDLQLFIDDQWRKTTETLSVLNPATEAEIGRLPVARRADLDDALDAAVRGFRVWSRTAPRIRAQIIMRAASLLRERGASEEEWLDNILELAWRLYLCSSPPYLLQTAKERRMRAYSDAAFGGRAEEARAIRDSLDPVRAALRETRPPEKPHAHQKYWQDLLGQTGGRVRPPCLDLTPAEKAATEAAFAACGLKL